MESWENSSGIGRQNFPLYAYNVQITTTFLILKKETLQRYAL